MAEWEAVRAWVKQHGLPAIKTDPATATVDCQPASMEIDAEPQLDALP